LSFFSAGLGQGWCREKKDDLNVGKCKFISFSRGSKPIMFQYVIGDSDLKRFDVINNLGVLVDSRITFIIRVDCVEISQNVGIYKANFKGVQ
jgi:hypothetical protein